MATEPQEFHMELYSAAHLDKFPNNKISEFTTPLSTPKNLTGTWVVAAKTIGFHNNIINIGRNDGHIAFTGYEFSTVASAYAQKVQLFFKIPVPGNYASPQDFVDTVNNLITYDAYMPKTWKFHELAIMTYNKSTEKLSLINHDLDSDSSQYTPNQRMKLQEWKKKTQKRSITFTDNLANLMGLEDRCIITRDEKFDLQAEADRSIYGAPTENFMKTFPLSPMWNPNYLLFIESDIVEPEIHGNQHRPHLCTIPVTADANRYEFHEIRHLVYKKVNKNTLSSIKLKVTAQDGENIKFLDGSGQFYILLHLKRVE